MIKAASFKKIKTPPAILLCYSLSNYGNFTWFPQSKKPNSFIIQRHRQSQQTAFIQGILSQVKLVSVTVRNLEDRIQSSSREQRQKPQLRRSHLLALMKGFFILIFFFFHYWFHACSIVKPILFCHFFPDGRWDQTKGPPKPIPHSFQCFLTVSIPQYFFLNQEKLKLVEKYKLYWNPCMDPSK